MNECHLYLYGEHVPVVNSFTFLGVLFDNKLTWKGHIESMTNKYKGGVIYFKVLLGSRKEC